VSGGGLDADVVVLGFGLAGAVAAAEAAVADPAAAVLVLEKAPAATAGGSSRASAQRVLCVHPDRAAIRSYQRTLNAPDELPPDVLDAWADGLIEVDPWLEATSRMVGMAVVRIPVEPEFPTLPGASCVSHVATIHPAPSGVWELARRLVERAGIAVLYECRALDLRRDGTELAIAATLAGEHVEVAARRAVVVATGGYEANPGLLRALGGIRGGVPLGGPLNTGDGVGLLQRAGARLWHLRGRTHPGGLWPAIRPPGFEAAFTRSPRPAGGAWLEVGGNGRFHDEAAEYRWTHAKRFVGGQWTDLPHTAHLPVHMIFDDSVRAAGPIVSIGPPPTTDGDAMGWNTIVERYVWSDDNTREVAEGWIARADSIGELAELLGRDPASLEAAVARFDQDARAGRDRDHGRDPVTMQPLDNPPLHGVELTLGITFTTGGGRRNGRCEVIGLDGRPLPGLYEAGQLGSIHANLFQNGASLAECIVSGRTAGREAALRGRRRKERR
jgi:hypothetical protein